MKTFPVIFSVLVVSKASIRSERNALPQEIFRDDVEPAKGGKVPEAAQLRAELELDIIDSTGLRDPEGIRMERMMAAESPELADHMLRDTNSQYQPGLTPAIRLKPGYGPPPPPQPVASSAPAFGPAQPYSPPVPVGPVLLQSNPHTPQVVEPLPITVGDTYTTFDCRTKPYPGRHYADVDTGCEIYHFCHEDGKQDTFQCSYGTVFNEYIGTCDFKESVQCVSGEGYAPADIAYDTPAPYAAPAVHVAPVAHAAPVVNAAPFVHSAHHVQAAPTPFVHTASSAPLVHSAPVVHATPVVHAAPAVHAAPTPFVHTGSAAPAVHAAAPFTHSVPAAPTPFVHSSPAVHAAPIVQAAPTPFVHTAPAVHSAPVVQAISNPFVSPGLQPATLQAAASPQGALPALKPFTNF